ncbi:MAG TPA: alpha/beta hydrolase [Chthoniobacteraceae bacterium]|jgi:acetyl esterase/lipase|nr:alpha/beta hydrolase [Chthoniobacteraceae bacterium]
MKTHRTSTFLAITCSLLLAPAAFSQKGAPPDPQMKAVLDALAALNPKPIETLSPEEARKQPTIADAAMQVMKDRGIKGPEAVGEVKDTIEIELSDHQLDARIYMPKGDGPFPIILYIHGGGWVIADLNVYDATPRALCNLTGAVVVSTHYRQAPEHKFPAAHQDVFGAYQWVLGNAGKIKGDAKRVAVVGESAGGNMAAAICMMAKEKGIQMPVHQVLVYPVADVTKMDTPSYVENAEAKPLGKAGMEWFGKHTLANPEDAKNPRLSLLLAGEELKGLPPATIILAQIDPLRSEGEVLARALTDAGVKVNLKSFDGVTHEFFGLGAVVDKAKEAQAIVGADLTAAFSGK